MTDLYPYMLPFAGLLLGSAAFIWTHYKSRDFDNEFQIQRGQKNYNSGEYADLKNFLGSIEASKLSTKGDNQEIIEEINKIQEKIKKNKN